MTFTEAAAEVLRMAGKPLHYKEITERAIEKNLLSHVGKSPEVTMGARLAALLKKEDKTNPIVRVKPGVFALREWEGKKGRKKGRKQGAACASNKALERQLKKTRKKIDKVQDLVCRTGNPGVQHHAFAYGGGNHPIYNPSMGAYNPYDYYPSHIPVEAHEYPPDEHPLANPVAIPHAESYANGGKRKGHVETNPEVIERVKDELLAY